MNKEFDIRNYQTIEEKFTQLATADDQHSFAVKEVLSSADNRKVYKDACDSLWDTYNSGIYTFLYRMMPTKEVAGEALQEVFSACYKDFLFICSLVGGIDESEEEKASRVRIDLYSRAYNQVVSNSVFNQHIPDATKGHKKTFTDVLQELSVDERACIILYYGLGISVDEILQIILQNKDEVNFLSKEAREKVHSILSKVQDKDILT